ncbi:MAG: cellulose binding domain-containing protein, partial [Lachnospiraceae bacterium]|nr:cellulose binding domain-containing protein [Lachnospiraceae bacterium]
MNALLRKVTRKLSFLLVVSILIGCIAPAGTEKSFVVYAAEDVMPGTVSTVQGDSLEVEFLVENVWENHCTMKARLTNTGDRPMENWALFFDQKGEITQIWNAQIVEQEEDGYTVENIGWNEKVEVGASVEFGYVLQSEHIVLPTTVQYTGEYFVITETTPVQGASLCVQGDGFSVKFVVENVWENHCNMNVILTNTGSREMENWSLLYTQKGEIIQIWNAQIAEQNGNEYVIASENQMQKIAPGESISFGYTVQGDELEIPSEAEYTGKYAEEENPAPTSTPEPTATSSPSPVPTVTPMPTATPSPVPTATPMPTATPSPSPTPTVTPMPTATPSPSPTPTATPTPSPSPTPTATPMPTATPSPSPTPTATPMPTATPSPSPTPTVTPMPTATPSPVLTATPMPTATPSPSPTPTATLMPTATPSPAPTATPKPTAMPSPVPTVTPSPSPTATPMPTTRPEPTTTPSPNPTVTPEPEEERIELTVSYKNKETVYLAWTTVENISKYQVKVNQKVVSEVRCVSGGAFQYVIQDAYAEQSYQISGVDEEGECAVQSQEINYTNIEKVGGVITEDTVWGDDVGSYEVVEEITVEEGATLRIKAGTILRFDKNAGINIKGSVIAEGEENKEIVFVSNRNEDIVDCEKIDGDWNGVKVEERGVFRAQYTKLICSLGEDEEKSNSRVIWSQGTVELRDCDVRGYLFGICLTGKGELICKRSNIEVYNDFNTWYNGEAAIIVEGETQVEIEECNIKSHDVSVKIKQQGLASFVMNKSELAGNGRYGLLVDSLGMGEISIKDNRLLDKQLYPVFVVCDFFCTGEEINYFSDIEEENGCYLALGGTLNCELSLMEGTYIFGGMWVEKDGILRVEAGTKIDFYESTGICVKGKALLLGEEEKAIHFTTTRGRGHFYIEKGGSLYAEHVYNLAEESSTSVRWSGISVKGEVHLNSCGMEGGSTQLIYVGESGSLYCNDSILSGDNYSIYVNSSGNVDLEMSTLRGRTAAVYLYQGNQAQFVMSECHVEEKGTYAIDIQQVNWNNVTLERNVISNCRFPFRVNISLIDDISDLEWLYCEAVYTGENEHDYVSLHGTLYNDFELRDGQYSLEELSVRGHLKVNAGVKIYSAWGGKIDIYGTMSLNGTENERVEWQGGSIQVYSGGKFVAEHTDFIGMGGRTLNYIKRSFLVYGIMDIKNCTLNSYTQSIINVFDTGELVCVDSTLEKMEQIGTEGDAYVIYCDDESKIYVKNNVIKGADSGICIAQSGAGSAIVVDNFFPTKGGYYTGIEIVSLGQENVKIEKNIFERNGKIVVSLSEIEKKDVFGFINDNEVFEGQNYISFSGTISSEVELPEGNYCLDKIYVKPEGTLRFVAGSSIITKAYSQLFVEGRLELLGLKEKRIEYRNIGSSMPETSRIDIRENAVLIAENTDFISTDNFLRGLDFAIIYVEGSADLTGCNISGEKNALVAVMEKGKFSCKNTTIKAVYNNDYKTEYAIYVEKESTLNVKQSIIEGETAIYVNQQGMGNVTIIDSTITGSLQYGIHFSSVGDGEYIVTDNTFFDCCSHPIYVALGKLSDGRKLVNIKNNIVDGSENFYDLVLSGTLHKDLSIPAGRYFCETIIVPEGISLELVSGVQVLALSGCQIIIEGTMQTTGTDESPVVITYAKDPEYVGIDKGDIERSWGGINVRNTGVVLLDNCVLRRGVNNISTRGHLSIQNSTIEDAERYGIYVSQSVTDTEISNCRIRGGGIGVYVQNTGFGACKMSDTLVEGCSSDGVYIESIGAGIFKVQNNIVRQCGDSPIYVELGGLNTGFELVEIKANQFEGNEEANLLSLGGNVSDNITIPKGLYACDNIKIESGERLTIEPATELRFGVIKGITVEGTLSAIGTPDEKIVLTSVGVSELNDISDAAIPSWNGITVSKGGKYEAYYNVLSYAFYGVKIEGEANITNSDIINSRVYGIYVDSDTVPIINYCFFSGNPYAMNNNKDSIVVDARYNYWGDPGGPTRYEDGELVGNGEHIVGNIDWSHQLGGEIRTEIIFEKTEGVHAATGNYSITKTDLSYACLDGTMEFVRTYNSLQIDDESVFGNGWDFNYACKTYESEKYGEKFRFVQMPDGREDYFKSTENGYVSMCTRNSIKIGLNGELILTTPDNTRYFYDKNGAMYKISDEQGNTVLITVDGIGNPLTITDCVGRTTRVAYENGRLISITDFSGRTVKYHYDSKGRLVDVIGVDDVTESYRYEGDAAYGISEVIDDKGNIKERLTYVKKNRQWRVDSITDTNGNMRTFSYEDERKATIITNSDGTYETHYYDEFYNIIGITDAEGETLQYGYWKDADGETKYGELQFEWDVLGNYTGYERDAEGNITRITHPDGGVEIFRYDERNHCVFYQDQMGVVTRYEFDDSGLMIREIVELSSDVSYSEEADADQFAITSYTYYDKMENGCPVNGLVKTLTTPEGVVTSFTYDRYGNRLTMENEFGYTTSYEYDELGRIISQVSPEGYKTAYEYDEAGRLTKTILHEGETAEVRYNYQGLPEMEISAEGSEVFPYEYKYDVGGNLIEKEDPKGNVTQYRYDKYGNVAYEKTPLGAEYYYTYDAKNRIKCVEVREKKGDMKYVTKEYTYSVYDKKLKVEEKIYKTATDYDVIICLYDNNGNLVEQTNPGNITVKKKYRQDGLLEVEWDALSQPTYYQYDALKNCTGMWIPSNGIVWVDGVDIYAYQGMTYNRDGQIKSQVQGVNLVENGEIPTEVITINYEYDRVGRLCSITHANGMTTTYTYDADNRCLSEETKISDMQSSLKTYTYNHLSEPSTTSIYTEENGFIGNVEVDETTGMVKLTTGYEYDKEGRLKRELAPDGTETTYSYDRLGNCVDITVKGKNGETKTETREYNALGKICKEIDANGNETVYEYDGIGNCVFIRDAEGGITWYSYDRAGKCRAEVTPANYRRGVSVWDLPHIEYTYDSFGRVLTIVEVDIVGDKKSPERTLICQYEYDKNGNLLSEKNEKGVKASYVYGSNGKIKEIITPEAEEEELSYATSYHYDALGRLLTEHNALEGTISYTYDASDNIRTVTRQAVEDGAEYTVSYNYDGAGNVLTEITDEGLVTNYTYNSLGLLLTKEITGAEGMDSYKETYGYDLAGQLVSIISSTGTVTKIEYDCFGNVTKRIVSDASGEDRREEKYTYDKNGNIKTYTNAAGVTTSYTYDALDRITSESLTVSEKAHTAETEYDANGNVIGKIDTFGNKTSYFYDAFNHLTMVVSPDGIVQVSYLYDAVGNCIEQKDAMGNIISYEYDSSGRITKTTDAEGYTTLQSYDSLGNLSTVTDGNESVTRYAYDGFGKLRSIYSNSLNIARYTYDVRGNLTWQDGSSFSIVSYTYNAADLLLKKNIYSIGVEQYTYNGDGSVKTMIDANGTINTYQYDVYGELVSETAVGIDGRESTYTYQYDFAGNLSSMTDGSGTTTYKYDELGRVTEKTVPNFGTVFYEYDLTDGVESGYHYELQTDAAGTTKTVYDRQNRVVKVITESTDGREETVEISYYDNGARKQVTYGDGSTEKYTFYGNGLVKGVTNKLADGTIVDQFSYNYDGVGNLISKIEFTDGVMCGETTYTYDKRNRLLTVTEPDGSVISYTYGMYGERAFEKVKDGKTDVETVTEYIYDEPSKLTEILTTVDNRTVSKTEYTYDANGNRLTEKQTRYANITESGKVEVITKTHTYDLRNQLICSVTEDTVITNIYNAAGYRVEKTVAENGITTNTYFLYDGNHVIMEADKDGITAKNTYGGPLLLRTVYGEDDAEETYQYLYNAHGDVVTLLSDGEVAATYCYDSF